MLTNLRWFWQHFVALPPAHVHCLTTVSSYCLLSWHALIIFSSSHVQYTNWHSKSGHLASSGQVPTPGVELQPTWALIQNLFTIDCYMPSSSFWTFMLSYIHILGSVQMNVSKFVQVSPAICILYTFCIHVILQPSGTLEKFFWVGIGCIQWPVRYTHT